MVDSGGLGVVIIVGGALEALYPDHYRDASTESQLGLIIESSMASLGGSGQSREQSFVHSSLEEAWGYCTEFIIGGTGLSLEDVRGKCEEMGRSTVVVGDSQNVRIHVHMEDPGVAISYGVSLGTVSSVKIENMDEQNVEWAAGHSAPAPSSGSPLTVVAVAAGRGLAELFMESGCGHVIEGGQTMNPSVQQIMQGVEHAGAEQTIFLPNNKNIVLTAQQVSGQRPDRACCAHAERSAGCRGDAGFQPSVTAGGEPLVPWSPRCPRLPPSRSPGRSGTPAWTESR